VLDPRSSASAGRAACRLARAVVIRQHAEHRDLAVVDFAQAPRPLPGDSNRALALLGKAAFVDDQATRRLAAEQAVRITADLRHHRLMLPRRVADEVLELLRAPALNHGSHRGERALFRLRQSAQIARCHRRVVARLGPEEPTVPADHDRECVGNAIDQRSGQTSTAHTVTRRIDLITSPSSRPKLWRPIDSTLDSAVNLKLAAPQQPFKNVILSN